MQTIRINSKGGDVFTLQQLLQEWGYDIPITGNFGQMTDKAVRDLQSKCRLTADGIVGRRTWELLMDKNARLLIPLRLKEEDFVRSAETLNVEVATVKAVQEVETGGRGGFFGVGLGNGHLRDVFAATEDLIFGLLCEELGMLTAFLIVVALAGLAVAAVYNAKFARSSFFTIAASAAAGMIIVQTALNVFGVTDFLPLTGVTLPFVSRGGSSMICSWGLLAFIKAADSRSYPQSAKTKTEGRRR